jgi:hypothetical protein
MNNVRLIHRRAPRFAAVIAFAALLLVAPAGIAQTPVGDAAEAHPVHIHSGTCAELGDVVVPLADVAFPEGEHAGAESAIPMKLSLNVVDTPLEDILAAPHAINVHQSADEIDLYIACGDIGGVITPGETGNDEIRFVLAEQNDSGHSGWVFLSAEGDQTEVNVMLVEPEEMG